MHLYYGPWPLFGGIREHRCLPPRGRLELTVSVSDRHEAPTPRATWVSLGKIIARSNEVTLNSSYCSDYENFLNSIIPICLGLLTGRAADADIQYLIVPLTNVIGYCALHKI